MTEFTYELIGQRKRKKRPLPELTEAALRRQAQQYIEKYGGPSASVRTVLQRKVRKYEKIADFDREEALAWVESVIAELIDGKALDDQHWANERARVLFSRGFGVRRIAQKLAEKRIPSAVAQSAIQHVTRDTKDPDLVAGHAYAERRRLGMYRRMDREEHAQKDLGKLARAGFSYGIARRIVDGDEEFE